MRIDRKAIRFARFKKLGHDFDSWIKMTDTDLLAEVQKVFPSVTSATRDECFKFLAMHQAEKLV